MRGRQPQVIERDAVVAFDLGSEDSSAASIAAVAQEELHRPKASSVWGY
jgi:hypothetical protein